LITGNHPVLERGYSPMTARFFMLQTHYSSILDFSNDALAAAEKGYQRLMKAKRNLEALEYTAGTESVKEIEAVNDALNAAIDHMNDDFNTALLLADLFELSNKINAYTNKQANVGELSKHTFTRLKTEFTALIEDVLGLKDEEQTGTLEMDGVMDLLIEIRQQARANRDFETSDKIRDNLKAVGIQILDGPEGSTWEKI